jgi:hypothetical protein
MAERISGCRKLSAAGRRAEHRRGGGQALGERSAVVERGDQQGGPGLGGQPGDPRGEGALQAVGQRHAVRQRRIGRAGDRDGQLDQRQWVAGGLAQQPRPHRLGEPGGDRVQQFGSGVRRQPLDPQGGQARTVQG